MTGRYTNPRLPVLFRTLLSLLVICYLMRCY